MTYKDKASYASSPPCTHKMTSTVSSMVILPSKFFTKLTVEKVCMAVEKVYMAVENVYLAAWKFSKVSLLLYYIK